MRKFVFTWVLLFPVFVAYAPYAATQECSTEKVNGSCTVTVDHSYPVTMPTIQMRPGARVKVEVVNALPFEILSLDLQSTQAVVGTDQTTAFLTSALPTLKNFVSGTQSTVTARSGARLARPPASTTTDPLKQAKYAQLTSDIQQLGANIEQNVTRIAMFTQDATVVYTQLNEVLGSIPPEVLPDGARLATSRVSPLNFPRPWVLSEFPRWQDSMRCELAGQRCPLGTNTPVPVLTEGATLAIDLGPCPGQSSQVIQVSQANPSIISCRITTIQTRINTSSNDPNPVYNVDLDPADKAALFDLLNNLTSAESVVLNIDTANITAINKDLGTYFTNIDGAQLNLLPNNTLGNILDPLDESVPKNAGLKKWLGRQVIFAINAVNQIGTPTTSVTTATQKKPIVTITVLYADPIFEVSAGAFFSTLANRSFANQTLVTQNPGASPTPGNVVIGETNSRPTVVPFVAANWRLMHDFSWPGYRRGAVYFTTAIGLNPNNTLIEFGAGPSVSWRSIMFSPLFHLGHDFRLTQGEQVGEIWCNQSGASSDGSIPKCSGSPPSPSTTKFWKGAFAFGISVRVPAVFSGGSH
ncbi:MAG TPA: hypothetical protein VNX26_00275 [Candidatus Acidoferrum sp.]|jgi:hypothetical protein|nr:hypothetical protein [Candidatus Acidoferrum sp.]